MNSYIKAIIFLATLSLLGCSSKPNVEVSIQPNRSWGNLAFFIQATSDDVVVKNVIINRGNCNLPPGTAKDIERTVKLKFGQSYQGFSINCKVDDVKEIEVETDVGEFVFSF
ncbi:hypothetical protein [Castellaniella sp.]|uniref:hypothetical protein n=1 Tax=Castellaniella sp. TaxID=1955812 RepID=UPI003C7968BC